MFISQRDKIWLLVAVLWAILFLGPGLLLFNFDVTVFGMPLLWVGAIFGWLTGIVLVYVAGYKLSCTNVEIPEEHYEKPYEVSSSDGFKA
ncbi:MAG: hypothetical protein BAA01_01325 [Bacillus thermozeamaize]|uniref:DUF3311 domain-containing protein n=1 Tax=Bacillus thermozeamaize TaxID=230954 RepID=A0A1Y3PIQ6_9BACI|nr:MAG: hypothetical protein BAA01_01325 [Bacillus thermozeamaize]